jgi:DNA repair exonuclease SbcCD ATPase subunit
MRKFEGKIKEQQLKQSIVISLKYILLAIGNFILIFNIFAGAYFSSANHWGEKFIFALSLKITLALLMIYFALKLNKELPDKKDSARLLDRLNSDDNETYLNAWELMQESDEPENPFLEKIFEQADEKAIQQKIRWNFSQLKKLVIVVGLIVLSNAILMLSAFPSYKEAAHFFRLSSLPQIEHKSEIDLKPGNLTVVRGTDVQIIISEPEPEVAHRIFYRQHDLWRENAMEDNKYIFKHIEKTTEYFVENDYTISDTFLLEVLELPAVKEISGIVKFPSYTKLPDQKVEGGNFEVLAGSKIELTIKANNPIQIANIVMNEEVQSMNRLGKSSFQFTLTPLESCNYYINLTDVLGNNSHPIQYEIKLNADKKPEIEIVKPLADTTLTQNMLLPILYLAADDFGLKEINLYFYKNSDEKSKLTLRKKLNKSLWKENYVWDLSNLSLFPGDVVSYFLEAIDNSSQKQNAKTSIYTARLPSIEEIYAEVAAEEDNRKQSLQESKKQVEGIQEELEEKRRELMKKDELDWKDKQDLQQLMKEEENLSNQVQQLAENYQQMVDKLEKNQVLSAETLEKMERISDLMKEISDEKLQEAMDKMQKSLENMDAEEVKAALEDMKFSLEEFNEKIERTLQMLEDIKKEQALQKASDIAEEMQKMQEELNKKTSDGSENNEQLAKKQKAIKKKSEALQKQMQEATDMMNDKKDADMKEQLEEMLKKMDDLKKDLAEASENLQQNDKQKAMQNQQNATQKMQKMNQKLSEMSNMMNMMGMQMDVQNIDIAIRRLLVWSAEHEKLKSSYHDDPYAIVKDLIANFEGFEQTLQALYQTPMIFIVLGQKFFIDASNTSQAYHNLFLYINDAKRTKVKEFLEDIQKGLNLLVYDLMQSKNNMQNSSGSGGGMQSLMQSLQQMGEQQMMMNMLTSQMLQQMGNNGKMNSSMRQEMGKLAADEQRLADNLKRAIQNNPEAQKQVNSLNRIIEDLESLSRNLKRGRLTDDIIDTQERILSRLLDAQKSIHQREFSKKRKAENSDIDKWDTPEEIKLKFEKMKRKALLEENFGNYTPEQQELIKEYLKNLNEE